MADVNSFLGALEAPLLVELGGIDPAISPIRTWMAVEDDETVTLTPVAEADGPAHELLAAPVDAGAPAAAYVTYVPSKPERMEAKALIREPRDSDIRWTYVTRAPDGTPELSAWEYMV